MEKQIDNKLNYLDITIENTNNTFTFSIYRKSTTTDLITHNESCHPTENKYSAIRHLTNRMNTYPISTESKHSELQLIKTVLHNNNYPSQTRSHTKAKQNKKTTPKQKWATFTYIGNETRSIARLFKTQIYELRTKQKTQYRTTFNLKNTTQINVIIVEYIK
jgi:hypothetical protein